MEAPKPAMTTTTQPQAVQMSELTVAEAVVVLSPSTNIVVGIATDMMNPPTRSQTQECQHHKANRLRGGGAAKDCFIGAVECFLCFEGCKECCECCADIVCCPCEMCC
ncbi:uncharacterized protein FIBRA_03224 [Fibroporia radiculosa]|uniref:Uncharacterized protein n=1 Tax=Fibroporia radiculosa TaxID=599839 RepID=J4I9H6_9APHY|nr:uncharacterized protein FIBRA_03224 [Fibroporia radiculosa]CCM01176.1 predicted protein [Fibroporia radiculosa]